MKQKRLVLRCLSATSRNLFLKFITTVYFFYLIAIALYTLMNKPDVLLLFSIKRQKNDLTVLLSDPLRKIFTAYTDYCEPTLHASAC